MNEPGADVRCRRCDIAGEIGVDLLSEVRRALAFIDTRNARRMNHDIGFECLQ